MKRPMNKRVFRWVIDYEHDSRIVAHLDGLAEHGHVRIFHVGEPGYEWALNQAVKSNYEEIPAHETH